ncbi:hypothetical protein HS7_08190 [Sulfolobales archaeon HS-7]|nr:hypothetical protein HS7_08190 [Sulfolobales archaeon HS-7]
MRSSYEATKEDFEFLNSVLIYQLGRKEADALLNVQKLFISRSHFTNRIRNVYDNDKLLFSLRPKDGRASLSLFGGVTLFNKVPDSWLIIRIKDEVAEFIAKGLSVFAKHVISVNPEIRPGDEVIVVANNKVVGVGRATLSGREIGYFNIGVAVKIRRGINNWQKL